MKAIGPIMLGPSGAELPLSAAVEAGGLVFVSGQLALDGGRIIEGGIEAQTARALDLIAAILADAGLTLNDVARCGVWLTDAADFPAFNRIYAERFAAPYPARATVISALAVPGAKVEIDAVAVRR